ncbi:hypothetical protein JHK87_040239 [Glycine soja]|nr:hypothetical protein JHK87_040239 [Glycine soja]
MKSTSFTLLPDLLLFAIHTNVQNGLVPCYLCAIVGTTSTTAIDPLGPLCKVEKEYGIWVHVDIAYVGSACICPKFRHLIDGVEGANSFSFNAHKWFLINLDCCFLWLKDPASFDDLATYISEELNQTTWLSLLLLIVVCNFPLESESESGFCLFLLEAVARPSQQAPRASLVEQPRLGQHARQAPLAQAAPKGPPIELLHHSQNNYSWTPILNYLFQNICSGTENLPYQNPTPHQNPKEMKGTCLECQRAKEGGRTKSHEKEGAGEMRWRRRRKRPITGEVGELS